MQANINETGNGPSGTETKHKMRMTLKKLTRMSNHNPPQTSMKKTGTKTHLIPLMKTPTSKKKRSQKSARPLRRSSWTYLLA